MTRRLGLPWLLQGAGMAFALGMLLAPAPHQPVVQPIRPATPAEIQRHEIDRLTWLLTQPEPEPRWP